MRRALFIPLAALLLTGGACQKVVKNTNLGTVNTNATVSTNDSGVLTTNTNRTSNTNVDTTNATVLRASIVTITANGLDPKSFSTVAGTTVTFQNQDSVGHLIVSNPHPTHTALPGFDAGGSIPPGGSYSFTFTKVGTWGYHDHSDPFNAKFQGSVTITAS